MVTIPAFTMDTFELFASAFAAWVYGVYDAFSSIILISYEGVMFSLFDFCIALLLLDIVILIVEWFRYGG